MLRALSTRRSRRGYEQLDDDASSTAALVPKLCRAKSLPAKVLSSSKKITTDPSEQVKKASKVHPFFSLFETRLKKKATAKPEFSRYLEYLKEGGIWDMGTSKPVLYYK